MAAMAPSPSQNGQAPIAIVVIGMAGSGKTTFMKSLHSYLCKKTKAAATKNRSRVYTVNLDPAVLSVPYPCNIDIRDSIKYKEVMKEYNLGPNGAIMTSLNLFATRFHKVLELIEKRKDDVDYILIDTPGQIEVFNWSASGTIILDSLAAILPVSIAYIVDTVRCERAVTFMSNMLYACGVLYKTKLPFVVIFNKTDVAPHDECLTWMADYDAFAEAVLKDESYMASLSRSCGLALIEFYKDLRSVGVSSATGNGLSDFLECLEECRKEYFDEYLPWLEFHKQRRLEEVRAEAEKDQKKFDKDVEEDQRRSNKEVDQSR